MTNCIIFPPLNRDNHIPIPCLLLANQSMLWEKGKKYHCILSYSFYSVRYIYWEGGKERDRGKEIPSRNVETYFRLQHRRHKACLSWWFFPKNCFHSARTPINKRKQFVILRDERLRKKWTDVPKLFVSPLKTSKAILSKQLNCRFEVRPTSTFSNPRIWKVSLL